MALYYLETSALVKLYVHEPGSERLIRLASRTTQNRLAVLSIAQVEFHSAVHRRTRDGDIEEAVAASLLERFNGHLSTRFLKQNVSELVVDLACSLVGRYPLRAYDAVQLAGCIVLGSVAPERPVFSCADHRLLEAAESEGLVCMDPTAA